MAKVPTPLPGRSMLARLVQSLKGLFRRMNGGKVLKGTYCQDKSLNVISLSAETVHWDKWRQKDAVSDSDLKINKI